MRLRRRLFAGLRFGFVEGFQKPLSETLITLRHHTQHFVAQLWPTTQHDWFAGRLHSFDVFCSLTCRVGISRFGRFPCASEQLARSLLIPLPKNVRRSRLNARTSRLIFETARLIEIGRASCRERV